MDLGLRVPIVIKIPDTLCLITNFKAQDSGFRKQKFPGFRNSHLSYVGRNYNQEPDSIDEKERVSCLSE